MYQAIRSGITGGIVGALIGAVAFAMLPPPGNAYDLYPDRTNWDSIGGSGTYNQGDYTRLRDNDFDRDTWSEETIRDNSTGDLYDCDSWNSCTRR